MSRVETPGSQKDHITIESNTDPKKQNCDTNNKNSIDEKKDPTQKSTITALVDEKIDPHAAGTQLGTYVFGRNLGKGTFGKVKLATHMLT